MEANLEKILVGVDDSDDALLAFDYAINLALKDNAELIVVSVLEKDEMNVFQALDRDYIHGEREMLEQHILDFQQQAKDRGIQSVRAVVAEGDPGEAIVKEVIPAVEPDLLVIGARAKQGVTRYFGSQAAYMAKYAPVSVTVVR
ncbi:universal stress protein [Lacticaseibacillus brantae]|uniref:Universal stress protein UspA-like nucleotide-binding protein n=1 Tax=Lacticaseibacillus brantae DSM 23927 TaxID=1423727 RepID=A0A0R2AZJ7_9LACO|nr:universal stress protein [Lacticaseibacillus brantae]KRM71188.1 universal stress protein UspA-like nucleotide-binding protein [Lacticaseibacillus brantae DSM 23927]